MKRRVCPLGLSVFVTLLLAAAMAFAVEFPALTAEIPFDFHVGKVVMPAGTYIVRLDLAQNGAIFIRTRDNSHVMYILTNVTARSDASRQAKMVFTKYGSEYFLSKLWTSWSNIGRELPKTKAELEFAKSTHSAQTTEVALGR